MSQLRMKIVARKNLKMSEGKLAAQCVHAALGLRTNVWSPCPEDPNMSVVVLLVSDAKFEEAKQSRRTTGYLVRDAGYTEVAPGTETCFAFYELDPRAGQ